VIKNPAAGKLTAYLDPRSFPMRFSFVPAMVSVPFVLFAFAACSVSSEGESAGRRTDQQSAEGAYDPCAGKGVGASCTICAPDDDDCFETMEVKSCNASGQCTSASTEGYDSCAGKADGDLCTYCAPDDTDCAETMEVKTCQNGQCGPETREAYEPCAGKSEGDTCTLCAPDDADCVETAVVKTCDTAGNCG
jgi:hypothetical protein